MHMACFHYSSDGGSRYKENEQRDDLAQGHRWQESSSCKCMKKKKGSPEPWPSILTLMLKCVCASVSVCVVHS